MHIDSIKGLMEREFSNVVTYFGDMKSFSALVGELENAIGTYSSTARNIKSGEHLYTMIILALYINNCTSDIDKYSLIC